MFFFAALYFLLQFRFKQEDNPSAALPSGLPTPLR
jgi:hypothetical protein